MYHMLILHVSCPNLLDFRGKNIQRIKVINKSPDSGNEVNTPKFQRGVGYLSALWRSMTDYLLCIPAKNLLGPPNTIGRDDSVPRFFIGILKILVSSFQSLDTSAFELDICEGCKCLLTLWFLGLSMEQHQSMAWLPARSHSGQKTLLSFANVKIREFVRLLGGFS